MELQDRIAEIEAFVRYLSTEWPSIQEQASRELPRRCNRCIVSEKYSPLVDGLCASCRDTGTGHKRAGLDDAPDTAAMQRELSTILTEHQGRGSGQYDALVLFSGGKDSAYLLQRLLADYPGLRMLAVTIDNGFFSLVAMNNAKRIIDRLKQVDHMVFKPNPALYEFTFRHAFTHLNQGGCYTTVDRMDGDLAFDICRNLAARMEIPLMIAGLSPEQVEQILGLHWFETDQDQERLRRTHCAGFPLDEIYPAADLRHWWDGSGWPQERIPRVLYPFYAWPYDEQKIREEVVRTGLIAEGQDNPLITNNDTIPLMLAVDVCFLGYSGFEPEFAELVRQGKADRGFWLNLFQAMEYLTHQGRFLPRCIDDTLGRLNLTRQDVGIP